MPSGVVDYIFEWDPTKASRNRSKHRIGFERAGTVFNDPMALSIHDVGHSDEEDRWVTIGLDAAGIVLVVVHTFRLIDANGCRIRLISARRATKKETTQYEAGQ